MSIKYQMILLSRCIYLRNYPSVTLSLHPYVFQRHICCYSTIPPPSFNVQQQSIEIIHSAEGDIGFPPHTKIFIYGTQAIAQAFQMCFPDAFSIHLSSHAFSHDSMNDHSYLPIIQLPFGVKDTQLHHYIRDYFLNDMFIILEKDTYDDMLSTCRYWIDVSSRLLTIGGRLRLIYIQPPLSEDIIQTDSNKTHSIITSYGYKLISASPLTTLSNVFYTIILARLYIPPVTKKKRDIHCGDSITVLNEMVQRDYVKTQKKHSQQDSEENKLNQVAELQTFAKLKYNNGCYHPTQLHILPHSVTKDPDITPYTILPDDHYFN